MTRISSGALALFLVLGVGVLRAPAAEAIPVLPGESLEIAFGLSGAPTLPAGVEVDTLTFLLSGTSTASGLVSLTVELLDGHDVLATNARLGLTDIAGFVEPGSAWTLNAVTVSPDFSRVRSGEIDGRIRVTPVFDGSPGAMLDAVFFPATGLQIGFATGSSSLVQETGDVLVVGLQTVVPEPGAALLLLVAAALVRVRR